MKKAFLLLLITSSAFAQTLAPLTVEKIMRDPKWMGVSPSNVNWLEDSKEVFFQWNPENNRGDSLYSITLTNRSPKKVAPGVRRSLPSNFGSYNRGLTKKLYNKDGDLFLLDIPTNKTIQITNTLERESGQTFSFDEKKILFEMGDNLFSWEISSGAFEQLTNFKKGNKRPDGKVNEQEKWLKEDQLNYFEVLKERKEKREASARMRKADQPKRPKEIYIEDKNVNGIEVSPDGKYIVYSLTKLQNAKRTIVPSYVTESGFTEDIPARTKVGGPESATELYVYDIARDTVLMVKTDDIPGITEAPAYRKDYPTPPDKGKEGGKGPKSENRSVTFSRLVWSPDGKTNALVVESRDNKDRWIMSLDVANQKLNLIDRQHDDAWIGGPGFNFFSPVGWIDNKQVYFQSEESGYSHLYVVDMTTGKRKALTSGKYEVQTVGISRDKKFFYLTTNEVHPGEKHFYKLPVSGGKAERLTSMTGSNEVSLSPDEKWLAIRYSYSNKPWELFLQENKPGAKPQQITNSLSAEFKSYAWKDPVVTTIKARDGEEVYARLYKPEKPNGAAVVFVHGAGYLQNAHKWWSSYFREYMFHNLLVDRGYTVLDMDYRASAGYGRDWRTGIYRFMGGKDLTDNVDGAKWLVDNHGVDPKRIGVYGGSYGGFITLMAMFTTPDVFAAGAALRPVTDWAQYNHGYTSNILNVPYMDSVAYYKSSPFYHAAGLKGHLLICHGMIDTNVHFQDAVKLVQRLIELGKDNWELAVYPMEDHGFVEPSSWTDEYKRILKLFETNLK